MNPSLAKRKSPVSSYTLKLIAVVSMLIDHSAQAIRPLLERDTYRMLRHVGRLAFPLFCFLLVEGLRHTHDRRKYLGSLGGFALLSELPSDLFFRTWATRGEDMSIFATLTLGLLVLTATEAFAGECQRQDYGPVPEVLFFLAACSGSIYLAGLLHMEYDEWGVGLIYVIYFGEHLAFGVAARMKNDRTALLRRIGASAMILIWLIAYDVEADWWSEVYGIPVLLPILLYNGERGSYRVPKWFFYVLYPAHLFLLVLLRKRLLHP